MFTQPASSSTHPARPVNQVIQLGDDILPLAAGYRCWFCCRHCRALLSDWNHTATQENIRVFTMCGVFTECLFLILIFALRYSWDSHFGGVLAFCTAVKTLLLNSKYWNGSVGWTAVQREKQQNEQKLFARKKNVKTKGFFSCISL